MKTVRAFSPDNSDRFIRNLIRVLFALSLILIALRFTNLNYDSPLFYTGYSNSEISDPYMYTSFARNKILHDQWDPYNYDRWDSWKLSIISGFSFLIFSVAGASRLTANISGLALQLGGFLFFMLALARYRPRIEVALGTFFLLITSGLFFAGRIPLLENGVIFLSGLTVWTYLRYRESLWGTSLAGALAITIALAAKLNGVALLAPLLVDTLLRNSSEQNKSESYKLAVALVAGFVLFGIAYSLIIFERSPLGLFEYFRSQTAVVGITPRVSGGFLETLASVLLYGSRNGLFRFQPFLMMLTGGGLILVALKIGAERLLPEKTEDRILLFISVWFLVGLFMLLPYSYRPARYFIPLMLPGAALSAYALGSALQGSFTSYFKLPAKHIRAKIVLVFCSLVTIYLVVGAESALRQFVLPGKGAMTKLNPTGIIIGLALVGALIIFTSRGVKIKKSVGVALGLLTLCAMTIVQSKLLRAGLQLPRDPLYVQSQEIGTLIGPNAVIAGTYGPAFTIDNAAGNLIHPFSTQRYEKDFFERFQVTHIAEAQTAMKVAQARYPALEKAHYLTTVWSRDGSFQIYRLPNDSYASTDFERGMEMFTSANLDSAMFYLNRFLQKQPQSFRARIAKAKILANQGKVDSAVTLLKELSLEFWDYYYVHLLAGREYVTLYRLTQNSHFKALASAEYARTLKLNPHIKIPRSDLP